ncbi:Retrovirus-related Pol polyprotein from transposon gypsy, partial [Mucuna pruriens]
MKQLATSNLEFQQTMNSNNIQFQQNLNATIQDLKTQVGQLVNTSAGSENLPSQTIRNPRGNANVVSLRSGRELPPTAPQQKSRSTDVKSEPEADSPMPKQSEAVTLSARKSEFDEDLLKMFRKVEINIPLLDAIKQIPKYAKFLKELCVHKRGKMKGKGGVELSGVMSALTKNEVTTKSHQNLSKKCRDPKIFSIPCTIGECTFVDAITHWDDNTLANRSVVQPLGVLDDVLVQVNELIFPANFYVLDMEDETSGKGSTLILGQPFLMAARTKINVHARTLLMEFGDNLVQFNIFEAMKHPTKDHSLFGIDIIEELVAEHLQLETDSAKIPNFAEEIDVSGYLGNLWEVQDHSDFGDDTVDLAHLNLNSKSIGLIDQVCKYEELECSRNAEVQLRSANNTSPLHFQTIELKLLSDHLKYAYQDDDQQFPVIIANNLHWEQEEKLLQVLRQHKKAIGLNLIILDVAKKEVTKLLTAGIIYPISDSQWVSLVQVVAKKFGMTVMKNQHDELVPMQIQNCWRVYIDYRKLNQATCKDHFPLPFIDQVMEKLARKSHYCFLDGFFGYMQMHIALEDQHKTTFT